MAALILGAGFLAHDSYKKHKAKKRGENNTVRFSELERQNAERIVNLQKESCFCQRSDWQGGGCPEHGGGNNIGPGVGVGAGAERGTQDGRRLSGGGGDRAPPEYFDGREGSEGRRSEEERARQTQTQTTLDRTEIARINEERRKKQKLSKRLFGRKER